VRVFHTRNSWYVTCGCGYWATAADGHDEGDDAIDEVDGQRIDHLRDPGAVQIETLVVGPSVLVVGADDVAPGPVSELPAIGYPPRPSSR
jgi:hypothetical protein